MMEENIAYVTRGAGRAFRFVFRDSSLLLGRWSWSLGVSLWCRYLINWGGLSPLPPVQPEHMLTDADASVAWSCSVGAVSFSAWTTLLYKYKHVLPPGASGAEQVGDKGPESPQSSGLAGRSTIAVLHVADAHS